MQSFFQHIELATQDPIELIDTTDKVKELLSQSGIRQGVLTVISRHTTAFVSINEREPRLQQDMVTHLKRLVPRDGDYLHNLDTIDGRDNAHSHLMGLFMNTSETIPIVDGALSLGTWQSIFFVELDGPRPSRQLSVHILGTN